MNTIPIYPVLYKRGNNNKILEWKLTIVKKDKSYNIEITYGENGGNLIKKITNIEKGKAGRTIIEQVIQEANKRFKDKKQKENYREEINEETIIEMRPMLAQTFSFELYEKNNKNNKKYKMLLPLFIQPKLDGIRCISYFNPGNEIKMISRKGTLINNFKDIKEILYNIIKDKYEKSIYIDGELYSNELSFEKISGLVRTQELSIIEKEAIKKIDYHIYDIYIPDDPLLNYEQRSKILSELINDVNEKCKLVETKEIDSLDKIKDIHQKYIEENYEGIILRDKDGKYEVGKRSKYLQKYKTFMDEDFEIIGYTDEEGMIIFKCKTNDNKEFSVRPRGSFEMRKNMFMNGEKYIGKYLTVIFQEYTELNIPRFPVGKCVRDYE